MKRRIDIGIDGGGTGCRVALSIDGGAVTETAGGPANIVTDPAAAEAAMTAAIVSTGPVYAAGELSRVLPALLVL